MHHIKIMSMLLILGLTIFAFLEIKLLDIRSSDSGDAAGVDFKQAGWSPRSGSKTGRVRTWSRALVCLFRRRRLHTETCERRPSFILPSSSAPWNLHTSAGLSEALPLNGLWRPLVIIATRVVAARSPVMFAWRSAYKPTGPVIVSRLQAGGGRDD